MKRRKLLLTSAAVLIFAGVTFLCVKRQPSHVSDTFEGAAEQSQPPPKPAQAFVARPSPRPRLSAPRLERPLAERRAAPAQQKVQIRADQVLASVNGVAITLKDLMPVKPEAAAEERTLDPDMYDMLLNRAVERELAFQLAQAKGVKLTETQQQNLARRRAQSDQAEPGEFDNLGRSAVNAEFEQRDSAGLMLLHNLAAAAGVSQPHVTAEQVQDYFAEHWNEYPAIPEEPAKMQEVGDAIDAEIRHTLAPALKAQHEEQFRKFVEELKSNAQIAFARPS